MHYTKIYHGNDGCNGDGAMLKMHDRVETHGRASLLLRLLTNTKIIYEQV